MSIVLAYPTLASPSASVTLGDVERLPSSRPTRRYQRAYETDAGAQVVVDFGGSTQAFSLDLINLSDAEVADLEAFFETTADGRANAWQLRDSLDREYDVRFDQDVFEAVHRPNGRHDLLLTVRTV